MAFILALICVILTVTGVFALGVLAPLGVIDQSMEWVGPAMLTSMCLSAVFAIIGMVMEL